MKRSAFIVFVLLSLSFSHSIADQRTALVIGNGAYKSIDSLRNPVNDAKDMAIALEKLGFDVILQTDANRSKIRAAVGLFEDKIRKGGIGLFYYAGHGVQVDGVNYILPTDINIKRKYDIEDQALKMQYVLGAMEAANNQLNVIILDACRNNPFRSFRGSSQGLARMDAPTGSIIAYATAPGKFAEDGQGRNGTYTTHLLKNLGIPGITIQQMLNKTGLAVMKATNNEQIPWISSTPVEDYSLASGSSTPIVQTINQQPVEQTISPSTGKTGKVNQQIWVDPVTGIEMVWVKPGSFVMGTPYDRVRREDEIPHEVRLTHGFYMQTTEVSQAQWRSVMGNNPSHFKGDNLPVENVSWDDAQAFIRRLNQKSSTVIYHLPTEAQWEYAARAGTDTYFSFGDCLHRSLANYDGHNAMPGCEEGGNRSDGTTAVKSFAPNQWGLYDMHGNVFEWCQDYYGEYPVNAVVDPHGPSSGHYRIYRGGSWASGGGSLRSADRHKKGRPDTKLTYLGFRLIAK